MPGVVRCEILPLPQDRFSFRRDGKELTCWHFGPDHKRPFLFPVNGPASGESLTRMGHPGAPDHDHHDSVWFAHHKLLGISFWSNSSPAFIRQQQWLAIEEADDSARLAVKLGWFDGHDPQPLVDQELVIELRPVGDDDKEYTLELSSLFRPRASEIEFQQTNFGFFAVRMARSISAVFGEGRLTSSSGATGEKSLFDKPAAWMDYSGPMPFAAADGSRRSITEGITLFDHPRNPGHPVSWHVRDDGWMGPSACHGAGIVIRKDDPLRLRYLLHVHDGDVRPELAARILAAWADRGDFEVRKATRPHRHFDILRAAMPQATPPA